MSRGKKIFVALAIVFVILLAYVSYDISRKTTFPGSKSQLKERLKEKYSGKDSVSNDSVKGFSKKN
jgi:ABC-type cobalt transport system substrate-binding protein